MLHHFNFYVSNFSCVSWINAMIDSVSHVFDIFLTIAFHCQHCVNIVSTLSQHCVHIVSSMCQHCVHVVSNMCQHVSILCQQCVNIASTFQYFNILSILSTIVEKEWQHFPKGQLILRSPKHYLISVSIQIFAQWPIRPFTILYGERSILH